MKTKLAVALAALSLAIATAADAAPKQHAKTRVAQEQRIACTVLGCQPIPRECWTTYGRTARGTPTGYDVIVCPRGSWPLR